MGDHLPQTIPGGTFPISFSEGARVSGTNRYSGWINGAKEKIPATYFLDTSNEDLGYWYDFALGNQSPYILKVFGKCHYDVDGYGNEREILFTELVEDTLETWANNNLLLESNYQERLSLPFMGILLDLLHGIIHFHLKLNRPHGEICSQNIYIVNGKAKLAHVVDHTSFGKSFEDDIIRFCAMVQQLFDQNGLNTPLELAQMCKSMRLHKRDSRFLHNSVNHPILLTPKERGEMRHLAHPLIRESSDVILFGRFLMGEIKDAMRSFPGAIKGHQWIGNVKEKLFLDTLNFQTTPAAPAYTDFPLDFIRYCRNVGEHVRGGRHKTRVTDEYRDKLLTSFFPGFLPILHDVLTSFDIYVRTLPAIT